MRRDSILIYLTDKVDRKPLEPVFDRGGLSGEIRSGGIDQAIADVPSWRIVPTFLVIDIHGVSNVQHAIARLSSAAPEGETHLILIGPENDVKLYRQLKAIGVAEYCAAPVDADELYEAIAEILSARRGKGEIDPKRLIGVIGARGGVGTSLITAALAHVVSGAHKKKTLLVDLDLEAGAQHVFFNDDPTTGLVDMLETPGRIDTLFLERTMAPVTKTLHLLSVAEFGQPRAIATDSVRALVHQAQQGMEMVVLEMPAHGSVSPEALLMAGTVFIVTVPTLLGLREALQIYMMLESKDFGGRICVIVNRSGEAKVGAVSADEFQRRFGGAAAVIELPFDPRTPNKALMEGKNLLELTGPLVTAFTKVVEQLPTHQQPKPSGWSSFVTNLLAKRKSA